VRIRADHREAAGGVPGLLAALKGVHVELLALDEADYVLSTRLAVERKTVPDLAASIVDRRLFAQVERLKQRFERVVYLIEGASLYEGHHLHPNAVRGALSYLAVLSDVAVLRSEGPEDSALLLATMARHEQQGLGYDVSLHRGAPSARGESALTARALARRQRYVVEDLPGIGPKLAHALLARFGSLAALFSADEEALRDVPGMGPKRARAVLDLIAGRYLFTDDDEAAEERT